MKRVIRLIALAAVLATGRAAAQSQLTIGSSLDSAIGLQPGTAHWVGVHFTNPYYGGSYPLQQARVTFVYDPAKVEIEAVGAACCSMLYTAVDTVRPGPGRFTVRGQGSLYGVDVVPWLLRVRLLPGVTDGAFIWAHIDSLALSLGEWSQNTFAPITQMCHATEVFGDVDDTQSVTSRDALIALSAAVGLPVTGYNLAQGDVDDDGLTNSRDALMMLHHAIGSVYPYTSILNRTGEGVPDVCPGVTAPGETIALRIVGASVNNDTIGVLGAAATTPTPLAATVGGYRHHPRLAADDARILYNCTDPTYATHHLCEIRTDGSGNREVLGSLYHYEYPDWNAAGDQFVVRYGSYPVRYDSGGANQLYITATYTGVFSQVYNRAGVTVAYNSYSGLRMANADGSGDSALTGGLAVTDARVLRYTMAGDTLLLSRDGSFGVWQLAGGTLARRLSFRLETLASSEDLGFDVGPGGVVFAQDDPGREGLWLLPSPTSPVVRLTRGRHSQPSFRRYP